MKIRREEETQKLIADRMLDRRLGRFVMNKDGAVWRGKYKILKSGTKYGDFSRKISSQ